jgi:hypothetical protein
VLSDDRIFIPYKFGVLKILSLNITKTRVKSFNCSTKTNTLFFHCKVEHCPISRTNCNDLGVLFDSKLYFHYHTDLYIYLYIYINIYIYIFEIFSFQS